MTEDNRLCAKCSKIKTTCCQHRDIFVTVADIGRIFNYTGKKNFHEFRTPSDPGYLDQDDDPTWAQHAISPDGTRRVLKLTYSGDCVFLSSAGCVLPMDIRPLVCRLFPFEYNEQGIHDQMANDCPVHLLDGNEPLSIALDMNRDTANQWHRNLYNEILEDDLSDENRNDLRPAV